MIALDASVVVELLTGGDSAAAIRHELSAGEFSLLVPHLLDVEVTSALRQLSASQRIASHRTEQFLRGLRSLPAERYAHTPLLMRMWELRHNFTAYDAAYVALAELTGSTLYTCDETLTKGHRARVKLFTE